jgi:hypothetical protein
MQSAGMAIAGIVIFAGVILAIAGSALLRSDDIFAGYRKHPVTYPLIAMLTSGLFLTAYFGAVPVFGGAIYPITLLGGLALVCLISRMNGGYLLIVALVFVILALLHSILGNLYFTEASAVYALLALTAALVCRLSFFIWMPRNAAKA